MAIDFLAATRTFVDIALKNYKNGTELISDHPDGITEQTLSRQLTVPIHKVAGSWLRTQESLSVTAILLRWGISQLRPDKMPSLMIQDEVLWLGSTNWRPVLALMSHYGFVAIPRFPHRHFHRLNDSALDTLCSLWEIGNSTFYRYLDRAKRKLAQLFYEQYLDGRYTDSLQMFVMEMIYQSQGLSTHEVQVAWHQQQGSHFQQQGSYAAAIWHWRQSQDYDLINQLLSRHLTTIAHDPTIDPEIVALLTTPIGFRHKVNLLLTLATFYEARNEDENVRHMYQEAVRAAAQDKGCMAAVYSQLGRYYESRDNNRAMTYYQDSLILFTEAAASEYEDEYMQALIRLGWLYTMGNDPRAEAILTQASARQPDTASIIRAELEQAWGEYHRRTGHLSQAIENRLRALNTYQLLENEPGIITSYLNLILLYGESKNFLQAFHYHTEIRRLAQQAIIPPTLLTSADINLGIAYFWQDDYEGAIRYYTLGLQQASGASLVQDMGRAHYNLAEVYYQLFLRSGDPHNEQKGDVHIAAAIELFLAGHFAVELEFARQLKQEILTGQKEADEQHLLPQEKALYIAETLTIEKNRQQLEGNPDPEQQVRAHIAIAKAYLSISIKERQQARQLCQQHYLEAQFQADFGAIQALFEDSLTIPERLMARWLNTAYKIEPTYLEKSLKHLLAQRNITKRTYASICGVSLTTASRHLTELVQANLLQRQGQGRSTYYILAETKS